MSAAFQSNVSMIGTKFVPGIDIRIKMETCSC